MITTFYNKKYLFWCLTFIISIFFILFFVYTGHIIINMPVLPTKNSIIDNSVNTSVFYQTGFKSDHRDLAAISQLIYMNDLFLQFCSKWNISTISQSPEFKNFLAPYRISFSTFYSFIPKGSEINLVYASQLFTELLEIEYNKPCPNTRIIETYNFILSDIVSLINEKEESSFHDILLFFFIYIIIRNCFLT